MYQFVILLIINEGSVKGTVQFFSFLILKRIYLALLFILKDGTWATWYNTCHEERWLKRRNCNTPLNGGMECQGIKEIVLGYCAGKSGVNKNIYLNLLFFKIALAILM